VKTCHKLLQFLRSALSGVFRRKAVKSQSLDWELMPFSFALDWFPDDRDLVMSTQSVGGFLNWIYPPGLRSNSEIRLSVSGNSREEVERAVQELARLLAERRRLIPQEFQA
jgi:DNA-binding transcriptional MocR family regulator